MEEFFNTGVSMADMIQTLVYREPHDINRRIAELGLTIKGRNRVRDIALGASAEATDFHPANAAGTLAYQHGTWALRDEFIGETWEMDTEHGVEAIRNEAARVKVIFANVDIACNDEQPPKPRSRKGAGSERACQGNLFEFLPPYAPRPDGSWATYYFMLDAEGAAELTRPIIKGNTFSAYVERIYLPDIEDIDGTDFNKDNDVVDIDPVVARK
jgi:hypothetical protein